MDSAIAIVSGEIMGLLPDPPSPPRKSHRSAETRHDRLARWRFDTIIAATALVIGLPLLHNNGVDFEAIARAITAYPERFPGLGRLDLVGCSEIPFGRRPVPA